VSFPADGFNFDGFKSEGLHEKREVTNFEIRNHFSIFLEAKGGKISDQDCSNF
jgi:hypothetical protein